MSFVARARRPENLVLFAAWACFTALTLLVLSHHEPWFDEAQAWLIARDSSPFEILFRRMHYEGTPAVWHLLLWCLIKSGLPYRAMGFLSVSLASIAVAVFLRFAPFPIWLRVLFVFGYFPAYQYSVIARSYVVNFLLIVVAAVLFSRRLSRPWLYCIILAALANANAFGFLTAAVLFLEFIWKLWRSRLNVKPFLAPAAIFLAFAIFAVVQAAPAPDNSFLATETLSVRHVVAATVAQIVFGFVQLRNVPGPGHIVVKTAQFVLSLAALLVSLALVRKARHLWLFVALWGVLLAFSTFEYFAPWHTGMIYLSWIFLLWLSWSALPKLAAGVRRAVLIAIAFILSFQAYDALAAQRLDFFAPYSAGPHAAERLRADLEVGGDPKLACSGFKTFAIEPYFDHNVCANYFGGNTKPAYYPWSRKEPNPFPDARGLGNLMRGGKYEFVLVSDMTISRSDAESIARRNGYCLLDWFKGRLIWKADFYQDDDLGLFQRCSEVTPKILGNAGKKTQ